MKFICMVIILLISNFSYSQSLEIIISGGVDVTKYYNLEIEDKEVEKEVLNNLNKIKDFVYKKDDYIKKYIIDKSKTDNFKFKKEAANYYSNEIFKDINKYESFFLENLIFISKSKDNQYTLMLSDFKGGNLKKILVSPHVIMSPTIYNDMVAYISFENYNSNIVLHNMKTKERKIVSNLKGVNSYPRFSKDGKNIYFSSSFMGQSDIYKYNIINGVVSRITNSKYNEISPDYNSKNLIFARETENLTPVVYQKIGSSIKRVFNSALYTISPFSRDNTIVAVYQKNRKYGLVIKDNKGERVLKEDYYIESPSISKNGDLIVYSTKKNNKSILEFMNTKGEILYQVSIKDHDLLSPSF